MPTRACRRICVSSSCLCPPARGICVRSFCRVPGVRETVAFLSLAHTCMSAAESDSNLA
jgi:hypothetical protein